jgi:hypothetical protein
MLLVATRASRAQFCRHASSFTRTAPFCCELITAVKRSCRPFSSQVACTAHNHSHSHTSPTFHVPPPVVKSVPGPGMFYRRPLPDSCIDFSSRQGKDIFAEALAAGNMECYFRLASQFRTQDEPAFCGLSTLVMVLNALAIDPGRAVRAPR